MNTLILSTGFSRTAKRWKRQTFTWDELVTRLRQPIVTEETVAEYKRMSKDEQSIAKDHGGFVGGSLIGPQRKKGCVDERYLITLDADKANLNDWDDVVAIYNWTMCVYSTHSHTTQSPRLRWIIPASRPMTPDEYEAVARKIAEAINIDSMDCTTYQPERLMFWPSVSQDGQYFFRENKGVTLDVDAVLKEYGPGEAWKDTALWPIGADEVEVVKRAQKSQADPLNKTGLIGLFCRTYDIPSAISEFLSDVYEPAGGDRYTYIPGSTSAGAVMYGDGRWLYSNHSTDPAGGLLCNAFDLVRIHRFGNLDGGAEQSIDDSGTKLKSYKAMTEWAKGLEEIKVQLMAERHQQRTEDMSLFNDILGADAAETETDDAAEPDTQDPGADKKTGSGKKATKKTDDVSGVELEEDDTGWEKGITLDRTGAIEPRITNVILILKHDKAIKKSFGLNEFTGQVCVTRDLPWRKMLRTTRCDGWEDKDDANLRAWFEANYMLSAREKILDGFIVVANQNAYHPIRDYLDNLKWDGVERLDTALVDWLGAKDSELTRAFTRKWFTAGVARIYRPGVKFDSMLLLIGNQGIGKSTFSATLSKGWYSDSISRLEGKDAYDAIRGQWIVEISELSAMKHSDSESVKQFFSKTEDTYRPAYGRNTATFRRQCIFFGTTNKAQVLKDKTGGRRFWPVFVEGINRGRLRGFEKAVDQLWAEAVVRYEEGEALWLEDDKLYKEAEALQDFCTVEDDLEPLIKEYLETEIPTGWKNMSLYERQDWYKGNTEAIPSSTKGDGLIRRDVVSVPEIRQELLGDSKGVIASNDVTTRRINDILTTQKEWRRCVKKQRRAPYGITRIFVRKGSEADEQYL